MILILKFTKSQITEISIPYKNFQNTLQRLSELVDHIAELFEEGIEVKHKQTNRTSYYTWINENKENKK